MSDADKAQSSQDFEGSMFLYSKPALLTKEDHGNLGLVRSDSPFDFVKSVKGVPVVTNEVQTAQKFYPIVFSDFDNPMMLAVVGPAATAGAAAGVSALVAALGFALGLGISS